LVLQRLLLQRTNCGKWAFSKIIQTSSLTYSEILVDKTGFHICSTLFFLNQNDQS